MAYIRSNEDYDRSRGLSEKEVQKNAALERNRDRANNSDSYRESIPGNYVGYRGTVDQQPDNPQNRYTDDD